MPSMSASWKRKRYLAINIPKTSGNAVASAPHRNRLMPCVRRPFTKPGPAEMPTMAMKILRPTEFMNHTVGDGILPKNGRVERNHPSKIGRASCRERVENTGVAGDVKKKRQAHVRERD